jgi:hypothetical protein
MASQFQGDFWFHGTGLVLRKSFSQQVVTA